MERDMSVAIGTLGIHRAHDAYLDRVLKECPGLPRAAVESSGLALGDAVVLTGLLDAADEPMQVLDVGTAVGEATFMFASHPSVGHVFSVTPNSMVAEKINDDQHASLDLPSLDKVRSQDLISKILADSPECSAKVEYFDGVLGGLEHHGAPSKPETARFDPTTLDAVNGELLAFIDGHHMSDGVFDDLDVLLPAQPGALVILNNCRRHWGPFVQRGVARFLDAYQDRFAFQLLADLSPGLGGSNLGIVYTSESRIWVPELVEHLVGSLSTRLDPLTLLARQQTLLEARSRAMADREAADREVRALIAALERRRQSMSWRITAPLRAVSRRLRRRR